MGEELLLDKEQVRKLLHVGVNRFIEIKNRPEFPKPIKLYKDQKKHLWKYDEIRAYVNSIVPV